MESFDATKVYLEAMNYTTALIAHYLKRYKKKDLEIEKTKEPNSNDSSAVSGISHYSDIGDDEDDEDDENAEDTEDGDDGDDSDNGDDDENISNGDGANSVTAATSAYQLNKEFIYAENFKTLAPHIFGVKDYIKRTNKTRGLNNEPTQPDLYKSNVEKEGFVLKCPSFQAILSCAESSTYPTFLMQNLLNVKLTEDGVNKVVWHKQDHKIKLQNERAWTSYTFKASPVVKTICANEIKPCEYNNKEAEFPLLKDLEKGFASPYNKRFATVCEKMTRHLSVSKWRLIVGDAPSNVETTSDFVKIDLGRESQTLGQESEELPGSQASTDDDDDDAYDNDNKPANDFGNPNTHELLSLETKTPGHCTEDSGFNTPHPNPNNSSVAENGGVVPSQETKHNSIPSATDTELALKEYLRHKGQKRTDNSRSVGAIKSKDINPKTESTFELSDPFSDYISIPVYRQPSTYTKCTVFAPSANSWGYVRLETGTLYKCRVKTENTSNYVLPIYQKIELSLTNECILRYGDTYYFQGISGDLPVTHTVTLVEECGLEANMYDLDYFNPQMIIADLLRMYVVFQQHGYITNYKSWLNFHTKQDWYNARRLTYAQIKYHGKQTKERIQKEFTGLLKSVLGTFPGNPYIKTIVDKAKAGIPAQALICDADILKVLKDELSYPDIRTKTLLTCPEGLDATFCLSEEDCVPFQLTCTGKLSRTLVPAESKTCDSNLWLYKNITSKTLEVIKSRLTDSCGKRFLFETRKKAICFSHESSKYLSNKHCFLSESEFVPQNVTVQTKDDTKWSILTAKSFVSHPDGIVYNLGGELRCVYPKDGVLEQYTNYMKAGIGKFTTPIFAVYDQISMGYLTLRPGKPFSLFAKEKLTNLSSQQEILSNLVSGLLFLKKNKIAFRPTLDKIFSPSKDRYWWKYVPVTNNDLLYNWTAGEEMCKLIPKMFRDLKVFKDLQYTYFLDNNDFEAFLNMKEMDSTVIHHEILLPKELLQHPAPLISVNSVCFTPITFTSYAM
ncbi:ORF69-like protein [Bufonid herpesvirus 1]|uniref:ORF69-like protein n=1 Tax=Bufonid herpesvirus 1 TaxID=2282206 RepID=UPI000EB66BB7|nr:ORF69-like protein [Bufonid herpesvirus 1]AXF48569.1 ORF69-like protein [Bufonid herpesvirus 1]